MRVAERMSRVRVLLVSVAVKSFQVRRFCSEVRGFSVGAFLKS